MWTKNSEPASWYLFTFRKDGASSKATTTAMAATVRKKKIRFMGDDDQTAAGRYVSTGRSSTCRENKRLQWKLVFVLS